MISARAIEATELRLALDGVSNFRCAQRFNNNVCYFNLMEVIAGVSSARTARRRRGVWTDQTTQPLIEERW